MPSSIIKRVWGKQLIVQDFGELDGDCYAGKIHQQPQKVQNNNKKITNKSQLSPKNHPKNLIPEEIPKVFGVCGPG